MADRTKSVWDDLGDNEDETNESKIPKRTGGALWRPCLIGLALGLVLAGIALAIVVVMLIQGDYLDQ